MNKTQKTVEDLLPGQSGIITSIGNSSGPVKRRLVDMGFTPGTEVYIKKVAPFGDPVEVELRGYEISIRKSDAAQMSIAEGEYRRSREKKKQPKTAYAPRRHSPETLERMRLAHEHELMYHAGHYDNVAHDQREMKIALAGNPNCGKTTLFNAFTGSDQYVGNWPGVTVEKKEGKAEINGKALTIVDLPGIYSLSPYSMEEIVTRDFIINGEVDAIIDIVDATNIERNLYLTVQLLELEKPVVIALNFMDEAENLGIKIDVDRLSKELGVPIVPIIAKTGENLDELLHIAHRQMHIGYTLEPDDLYDDFTHYIHHEVDTRIHDKAYANGLPAHWTAIKLLEGDPIVEEKLGLSDGEKADLKKIFDEYEASSDLGDRETLIADSRYAYIEKVLGAAVIKNKARKVETVSDRIDKIVTGRVFAVPVFLLMMLIMFVLTFGTVGSWLNDLMSSAISAFSEWLRAFLTNANVAGWLVGLITDGIISGVGGVLTFLPQIAILFFCLSLLEDSGYMSRAAFIMDRVLRRFGLSGKAFIPMLMGFGCTVPAVMGARTMENEKDRRMTILLVPFMSCSAKLPVYGLITAAFFGAKAGLVVFGLYVTGLVMAIISGLLFKNTLFRGETAAFVLELPPYRLPSLKNTLRHVWERVKGFLVKAGTLILVMSVVLWFLQSFDLRLKMVADPSASILGSLGGLLAPLFKPLGFGMWQACVALLTGIVAKEAVVSSLSMFYGFSLTATGAAVAAAMTGFTPLSALSFLVFVLLYVPCVASISTIRREMNSVKWTLFSIGWQLTVAYVISFAVYQIGRLLGLG